jgi:hypothetical protein
VPPADNNVTSGTLVAVFEEVAALELELNPYTLPFVSADLPFRFTIREARLNSLDHVAQFPRNHSKEKHNVPVL